MGPNILLLGSPGSGKGSVSELIVREYGLVHISVGDLLREEVEKGTPLGREVASRMDEGHLITDEIVVKIMKNRLKEPEVEERGVVLDGFPRTLNQAIALSGTGFEIDAVIYIKVDAKVVEERCLLRRLDPVTGRIYNLKSDPPPEDILHRLLIRSDDTKEKHQRRMKIYSAQIKGLLSHYTCRTVEVDGNAPLKNVYTSLKTQLDKMLEEKKKTSKI